MKKKLKINLDKKTIKAEVDKFRKTFKNVKEDGKDFFLRI